MTRKRFEQLVERALADIPRFLRDEMQNVAVVVEDEPSAELLEEMGIEPPDTLYGLYQGTPLAEREWAYGNTLPDRIAIYQRPIVEDCEDDDDIVDCIAETVFHEFAHHFGWDEDHMDEVEVMWRGETGADDE